MPDIKHNFAGGKMNKDLDERLVPNGEYRDAMNIQVQTSEGSGVGTIQNILGNNLGCDYANVNWDNPIPSGSITVGSVSDEKNDSLYWLISGNNDSIPTDWTTTTTLKDMIMRTNPNSPSGCEPVFVDVYGFKTSNFDNSDTSVLNVTSGLTNESYVGYTVTGITANGDTSNTATVTSWGPGESYSLDWELVPATTSVSSPICMAGSSNGCGCATVGVLGMPGLVVQGQQPSYTFFGNNKIYLGGCNTASLNSSDWVGGNITLFGGTTDEQTFNIINAQDVDIIFANGLGSTYLEITLDSNMVDASGNINSGMNFNNSNSDVVSINGTPYAWNLSSSFNGTTLEASGNVVIPSTDQPSGWINIALPTTPFGYDVSDFNLGDSININMSGFGNSAFCICNIDTTGANATTSNAIQVATPDPDNPGSCLSDCGTLTPPPSNVPGYWVTGGTFTVGNQMFANLDTILELGSDTYTSIIWEGPRVLNFNHENLITGINIVDDMLYWTDGLSEPKKINTNRSVEGTDPEGQTHTSIINPELPFLNEIVRPHHIQVLKRKPTKSLNVVLQDNRRPGVVYSTTTFKFSNSSGNLFQPGFTSTITVDSGLPGTVANYQVGDTIMLLNTLDLLAVNNETLPHQYDVRLVVESINPNLSTGTSQINFEILSISAETPVQEVDYTVLLSESESDDFKNSMFRFSYRYKFLDGETSAFAPFTPVAFIPGEFKYNKTNAYNEGMVNNVSKVVLNDFLDLPNTLDVSSVDLLVKYENSPNVYIIDTVRRGKFNQTIPDTLGNPFGGTYTFNPKQIKATLPENQLLRVWDNVPKRAIAQEITGNRLVYGNYAHSYDYKSEDLNIIPSIKARNVELARETDGAPSIKTQRSYQLGVVFVDSEGRESPIITNETSSITVGKPMVNTNTMLSVVNNSSIPSWVNSYKYYVKDHMQPFYNIVIDSFYKAQNGDFWISVPSSERNKVQEGDLLELKKGINSNTAVLEKSETKVIAIENEAPDFIKTSFRSLGKAKHEDIVDSGTNYLIETGGLAAVGKDWFWIDKTNWLTQNSEGFGGGGDLAGFNEMAIRFEASPALNTAVGGVYKSRLYECSTITIGDDGSGDSVYIVRLKERISEADNWIIDPADADGEDIEPTLKLEVFEKIISPSADYHGKFFAKIEAKEDLLTKMAEVDINSAWQEQQHVQLLHNFCDEGGDRNTDTSISGVALTESDYDLNSYAQYPPSNNGLNNVGNQIAITGATDNYLHWENMFEYFNVSPGNLFPQYWFIDRMYYRGLQHPNKTEADVYQDGSNMGRGIFQATAADEALNLYGGNFVYQGKFYMEISLVGMFPMINPTHVGNVNSDDFGWDARYTAIPTYLSADPASEVLSSHVHTFVATHQADTLHHLTVDNQRFKWEGSDKVFTITNSTVDFRYNYAGPHDGAVEELWDEHDANVATPPGPYFDYARKQFAHPLNRRLTIIVEVDQDPRVWGVDPTDSTTYGTQPLGDAVGTNMVFLETGFEAVEGEALTTTNPAVFEVKKTDEDNLDIYYEASGEIPIDLSYANLSRLIPVGSKVTYPGDDTLLNNSIVTSVAGGFPSKININNASLDYFTWQDIVDNGDKLLFITPSGNSISIALQLVQGAGWTANPTLTPVDSTLGEGFSMGLTWFNCVSFRNGVESFYLKDDFNEKFITRGVKASSTLDKDYEETHRKSGLIYSGIYNSTSGVNNLNQFIAAEKITKDINPIYGSIQRLHSGWGQGGDLVTLCEDRVLKILANKDALYNADGNSNVTSTNNVLGQTIPYSGEYGISKNPESFASDAYRAYFTDKVRGTVMRLSMDGLTPISEHGMKDWFRRNLKLGGKIIGSYDDRQDEYNVNIVGASGGVVSFSERVKGWVSFKSFFQMEDGISCASNYYTFKDGNLYKHHDATVDRNTFYPYYSLGTVVPGNYTDSSFTVLINELPGSVKTFHTLNYEGSQSKIDELKTYSTFDPGSTVASFVYNDNDYYNLSNIDGWYVQSIKTDLEEGSLNEFIEKEGKWFNYIKGIPGSITDGANVNGFSNYNISFQGLGRLAGTPTLSSIFGCTYGGFDAVTGYPNYINYNAAATVNNGSCIATVPGCTDPTALNYSGGANYNIPAGNAGACQYAGCTDSTANNYNAAVTIDDGSCIYDIYGCMDNNTQFSNGTPYNTSSNFNNSATMPCDGSNGVPCVNGSDGIMQTGLGQSGFGCCCNPVVPGCTDPTADNYDSSLYANTDDGSCFSIVLGCIDLNTCSYDPLATNDTTPTSCFWCNDATANNFDDHIDATCDTYCEYCSSPDNYNSFMAGATEIQIHWDESIDAPLSGQGYEIQYAETGTSNWSSSIFEAGGVDGASKSIVINGLTPSTTYDIQIRAICVTGQSPHNPSYFTTSAWLMIQNSTIAAAVPGCTDNSACNYDAAAVVDDGSCILPDGCTNPIMFNYDPSALCDDGSCIAIVNGCTDSSALNYNQNANTDNGSCSYCVYGCMDATASNYDSTATCDDGSCTYCAFSGCTDPDAFNYDFSIPAGCDDGSCIPFTLGCMDTTADNYDPNANMNDPNSCTWSTLGCMDSNADNYVATATTSSNYCTFTGCHDPLAYNYYGDMVTQNFGNGAYTGTPIEEVPNTCAYEGCVDNLATNYNVPLYMHPTTGVFYYPTIDDGSCTYAGVGGCTDNTMFNYDASAAFDDGSCIPFIYGCTDNNWDNYDSNANTDDGTCAMCSTYSGCDDDAYDSYDSAVFCPDNASDCIDCQTDASVATAYIHFVGPTGIVIRWNYMGSNNTNGTNQGDCVGSPDGLGLAAYTISVRYKGYTTPWSAWIPYEPPSPSLQFAQVEGCTKYGVGINMNPGLTLQPSNVPGTTSANFGMYGHWQIKVQNECSADLNCSTGPEIESPIMIIP